MTPKDKGNHPSVEYPSSIENDIYEQDHPNKILELRQSYERLERVKYLGREASRLFVKFMTSDFVSAISMTHYGGLGLHASLYKELNEKTAEPTNTNEVNPTILHVLK